MGHEQSHMPSNQGLQPGIYRIVSASAGTAISISSYGYERVEAWQRKEDDSQKWLVRQSGDGYTFNNRRHNTSYLAVGSTSIQSPIYASKFPTTWELLQQGDYYFINKPGRDRVLDLHRGKATNGNKIHIRPRGNHPRKHWSFEYLEHDTQRFIHEHFGIDSKEGKYLKTIAALQKEAKEAHIDILKKNTLLSDCKDDLRRLQEGGCEQCCLGTGPDMNVQNDQSAYHITNNYNCRQV
ncbi:hypothetical protein V565_025960 [Rhizoctonia solani 123E]|uniref:Ricin B lectin domain-containing protein n=1 Tax=Rhizoctonia solani 123E TaxID=1423351 RepID=A0A074S371_9AGAM|nr:hypothetical protein V565_025960 [Rhizoctonia solani 123E]